MPHEPVLGNTKERYMYTIQSAYMYLQSYSKCSVCFFIYMQPVLRLSLTASACRRDIRCPPFTWPHAGLLPDQDGQTAPGENAIPRVHVRA